MNSTYSFLFLTFICLTFFQLKSEANWSDHILEGIKSAESNLIDGVWEEEIVNGFKNAEHGLKLRAHKLKQFGRNKATEFAENDQTNEITRKALQNAMHILLANILSEENGLKSILEEHMESLLNIGVKSILSTFAKEMKANQTVRMSLKAALVDGFNSTSNYLIVKAKPELLALSKNETFKSVVKSSLRKKFEAILDTKVSYSFDLKDLLVRDEEVVFENMVDVAMVTFATEINKNVGPIEAIQQAARDGLKSASFSLDDIYLRKAIQAGGEDLVKMGFKAAASYAGKRILMTILSL